MRADLCSRTLNGILVMGTHFACGLFLHSGPFALLTDCFYHTWTSARRVWALYFTLSFTRAFASECAYLYSPRTDSRL
jgi:hypothetical protein